MLFIKNGNILDPYTNMDSIANILINDEGIITQIGKTLQAPENCDIFDATDKVIAPGFVDVHVHFRDPGQTAKEDIFTGAQAAIAGGYTSVVCMANTSPVCDNLETLNYIKDRIAQIENINILQACAISNGLQGKELTDFDTLLKAGAAGFTDDGINLTKASKCAEAMELAVKNDTILSFHEEDGSLVPSPGVNFGSKAAEMFGVQGAKAIAEDSMVGRDIALSLATGARVIFQHISSQNSVKLIREGKKLGANIYAEVTPHHISLTEDDVLTHGTYARMNPPLRTESDRQALIAGLADGTIDMIATDHAPHTTEEKAREFRSAPSGITGLETAFSVCNTALVQTGKLSKMQLIKAMSVRPAQIYRMESKAISVGNKAELVVLDFNSKIKYENYKSKSSNTPFTNVELVGKVCTTVFGNSVSAKFSIFPQL